MQTTNPVQVASDDHASQISIMSRELVEHGLGWDWIERKVLEKIRDPERMGFTLKSGYELVAGRMRPNRLLKNRFQYPRAMNVSYQVASLDLLFPKELSQKRTKLRAGDSLAALLRASKGFFNSLLTALAKREANSQRCGVAVR